MWYSVPPLWPFDPREEGDRGRGEGERAVTEGEKEGEQHPAESAVVAVRMGGSECERRPCWLRKSCISVVHRLFG